MRDNSISVTLNSYLFIAPTRLTINHEVTDVNLIYPLYIHQAIFGTDVIPYLKY